MTTPPEDRDAQAGEEPISGAEQEAERPDASPAPAEQAAVVGGDDSRIEQAGADASPGSSEEDGIVLSEVLAGSATSERPKDSDAGAAAGGGASADAAGGSPDGADGGTTSAPVEPPEVVAARRKDRTIGLLIVCGAFIVTLGLSWWAKRTSAPLPATPPAPATTAGVVGWPDHVDPIANLRLAGSLTDRQDLRGIVITGVAPDGTVDMKLASSRVRYAFQSPPGEGPQPARPPGTLPKRRYCGKQNVHIKREGIVADPDVTNYPCGMRLPDPLPEPRCGPKDVWKWAADNKKVPTEKRRARIEYYRAKSGPAWRFELPGTRHRFSLYGDCARELKPVDAIGTVP